MLGDEFEEMVDTRDGLRSALVKERTPSREKAVRCACNKRWMGAGAGCAVVLATVIGLAVGLSSRRNSGAPAYGRSMRTDFLMDPGGYTANFLRSTKS